jgi:N-acetylglucosamine kinase-like BadF-type ATPase
MKIFIGIDGGGTKTKCVCADEKLKIISQIEAGATNPLTVGFDQSAERLFNLIKQTRLKANVTTIDSIAIGIAGGGRVEHSDKLYKRLNNLAGSKKVIWKKLKIFSDAEIAIEGAFSGHSGFILIAGTGSILFGKDKYGNIIRAGGFGRIIGDEGSGYSIGKKGLNAVAREFDGRGEKTLLTKILKKKFGIVGQHILIENVYSEEFVVAEIAESVIVAAKKNDRICIEILQNEANELLSHIEAIIRKTDENKLNLCLAGGLLLSKNYYSTLLKRKINEAFENIVLRKVDHMPEIGAILLAKKYFELNNI